MRVDLHLHTNASDGLQSPSELVALLLRKGVTHCAVTDHDTMNGVTQALEAARAAGIVLWPGVELSTEDHKAEVHVLGYFRAVPDALIQRLEMLRQMRIERLERMIEALICAGVSIEMGDVHCEEGAAPGRMHVARALIARGYALSINEAFRRFLLPGRPGYVEREKLNPAQAIALIHEHGGLSVLAHPGIIHTGTQLLPVRMGGYVEAGLMGIEACHPRHTPTQRGMLRRFAQDRHLLVTGGSDYHGTPGANTPGDKAIGWTTAEKDYARFEAWLTGEGLKNAEAAPSERP